MLDGRVGHVTGMGAAVATVVFVVVDSVDVCVVA